MRLVQYRERDGRRAVAASEGSRHYKLDEVESVYELVLAAIESDQTIALTTKGCLGTQTVDLASIERDGRLLPPIEHPVPTRCWVTESGLGDRAGSATAGPSWSFRGNGATLVAGGQPLFLPDFAPQGVALPRLFGVYVIADDGTPCQVGWTLGWALTGLGLPAGHSHLRPTALGPELLLGASPPVLAATVRVHRGGALLSETALPLGGGPPDGPGSWPQAASDHFRYEIHRRPGDVHLHALGEGTAAGTTAAASDDVFEVEAAPFSRPLVNRIAVRGAPAPAIRQL